MLNIQFEKKLKLAYCCGILSPKNTVGDISMKFEYVEYHKRATDDELINDLKQTAQQLGFESLSAREYDENGSFSSSAVERRFGTWNKALEIAGLGIRCREYNNTELFKILKEYG